MSALHSHLCQLSQLRVDVNFYAPLRCKLVHYLYITDAMSQNFVTLEVVRQLLQTQKRSYQAAIKLLITDVRSEMKDIKKEIEEFMDSLEFTQREVNDNQDRVMDIETRLEGLKVRIDDQMDTIEKVEDDVEYIENQSRRNNIKILGVEENNTTEKSWDDTEKMVKNIIREKLDINEEINIERAHRVGKPRPPPPPPLPLLQAAMMGQRLHQGPSSQRSQVGSKKNKFSVLHGKKNPEE